MIYDPYYWSSLMDGACWLLFQLLALAQLTQLWLEQTVINKEERELASIARFRCFKEFLNENVWGEVAAYKFVAFLPPKFNWISRYLKTPLIKTWIIFLLPSDKLLVLFLIKTPIQEIKVIKINLFTPWQFISISVLLT